jgi:hypothetical protein
MIPDNIKSLTVVGPLLASTLAVTYDVGFFYGSDIGFFTFFSLTEHLVFALQAAPFAVVASGTVIGWLFGTWLGYQQGQELVANFVQANNDERQKILEKAERTYGYFHKARPYAVCAIVVSALAAAGTRQYALALATLFGAASMYWFPTAQQMSEKPSVRTTSVAAVALTALTIAFAFGYERAQRIVTSTAATETIYIGDKEVPARLIRSGDKGVLFYSVDTKKIRFVRWEAIKQIDSI